jgi:c-di-GMP-binding flagellar brake protein YcgR
MEDSMMGEKENKARYGTAHFERRRHPRFNIDLPIEYRQTGSSAKDGRTINASEGGFAAYFQEQLDVGQQLRARLFFSSGPELNAIEMVAEVTWVDNQLEEDRKGYRTGVKFLDISTQDLDKLKKFLIGLSR